MLIYIHIPFCVRKCLYCAFYSIPNGDFVPYVRALCNEISLRRSKTIVDSVFFGGGTPSILPINLINTITDSIRSNFVFTNSAEISIECNVATLNETYLRQLRQLGFNRISLGVQSFDDRLLKLIGRLHNSFDALKIIETAHKFFDNINIDLMYGLPSQSMHNFHDSINIATSIGVSHLSVYGLEIEPNSAFFDIRNQLDLPNEDILSDMYDFFTTELPHRGYFRYEISNFAKSGFECRHNLGYWNDAKYIGLGAAAHSYDGYKRFSNVANVKTYVDGMNNKLDVSMLEEIVTTKAAIEEFCFLALRTSIGINKNNFKRKFDVDIESIFGDIISKFVSQNLIEVDEQYIRLSALGMKFANIVCADFLLD